MSCQGLQFHTTDKDMEYVLSQIFGSQLISATTWYVNWRQARLEAGQ